MATKVNFPTNVNKDGNYGEYPYYVPAYGSQDDGILVGATLSGPHLVRTGVAAEEIKFGLAVYPFRDDSVKSTGTAGSAWGVAIRTASEKLSYSEGDAVNVLTKGEVYVKVCDGSVVNGVVYTDADGNIYGTRHQSAVKRQIKYTPTAGTTAVGGKITLVLDEVIEVTTTEGDSVAEVIDDIVSAVASASSVFEVVDGTTSFTIRAKAAGVDANEYPVSVTSEDSGFVVGEKDSETGGAKINAEQTGWRFSTSASANEIARITLN